MWEGLSLPTSDPAAQLKPYLDTGIANSAPCSMLSDQRMPQTGEWDQTTHNVLSTFQMKYRPANIDGKPDTETAAYLDVASTPGGLRMLAPTQAR